MELGWLNWSCLFDLEDLSGFRLLLKLELNNHFNFFNLIRFIFISFENQITEYFIACEAFTIPIWSDTELVILDIVFSASIRREGTHETQNHTLQKVGLK